MIIKRLQFVQCVYKRALVVLYADLATLDLVLLFNIMLGTDRC